MCVCDLVCAVLNITSSWGHLSLPHFVRSCMWWLNQGFLEHPSAQCLSALGVRIMFRAESRTFSNKQRKRQRVRVCGVGVCLHSQFTSYEWNKTQCCKVVLLCTGCTVPLHSINNEFKSTHSANWSGLSACCTVTSLPVHLLHLFFHHNSVQSQYTMCTTARQSFHPPCLPL